MQFCIFALLQINAQTPTGLSINSDGITGILTDIRDGQRYKAVLMPDNSWWMAENLRYRKGLDNPIFGYRPITGNIASPGTSLQKTYYCPGPGPFANSPNTTTSSQADPISCEYKGCLYPFWTAYGQNNGTANIFTTSGEQGVCPNGWHLPSDNEWTNLAAILNNNFSSLQILASGYRVNTGVYADNNTKAYFWTSTGSGTAAVSRSFSGGTITRNASQPASDALPVRCKDGKCIEISKMVLTVVPNTENCGTEVIKYKFDTIEFSGTTKERIFTLSLSPALSTGTWTYSISDEGLPNNGVSFVSNPTISATQITLKLQGLSASADNQTFKIKIMGTNPNYCKLDTQVFNIRLLKASTSTTFPTFTDARDGKDYKKVLMPDGKWWMAENLNYQVGLKFNANSNKIGGDATTWTTQGAGSLAIGNFWCPGATHGAKTSTLSECDAMGALYTFECALRADGVGTWTEGTNYSKYIYGNPSSFAEPTRGICPNGWHIPSDKEWGDMLNAVETAQGGTNKNHNTTTSGAGSIAGQKLKSCFLSGISDDTYGFSVLAAGYRLDLGSNFGGRGTEACFWSATSNSTSGAWYRSFYSTITVYRNVKIRSFGLSVRCVQD